MIIEDEAGEEEHGLLLKKVKNILLQTDFKGKKCCKEKHRKKSKPTQVMNKKKNNWNLQEPIGLIVSLAPTSIHPRRPRGS